MRPRLLDIVFHSSIIKELTSDVKYYFYFISMKKYFLTWNVVACIIYDCEKNNSKE